MAEDDLNPALLADQLNHEFVSRRQSPQTGDVSTASTGLPVSWSRHTPFGRNAERLASNAAHFVNRANRFRQFVRTTDIRIDITREDGRRLESQLRLCFDEDFEVPREFEACFIEMEDYAIERSVERMFDASILWTLIDVFARISHLFHDGTNAKLSVAISDNGSNGVVDRLVLLTYTEPNTEERVEELVCWIEMKRPYMLRRMQPRLTQLIESSEAIEWDNNPRNGSETVRLSLAKVSSFKP